MNGKAVLFLSGALIGATAVTFSGEHLNAAASAVTSDTYRALGLFYAVFDKVRRDYVEKPDDATLVEGAIKGMLGSLDPHSSYMNPRDFKAMQAEITGKFGGLGIEVTMENGVSRWSRRSTIRPPPARACWPTISSSRSTAPMCKA